MTNRQSVQLPIIIVVLLLQACYYVVTGDVYISCWTWWLSRGHRNEGERLRNVCGYAHTHLAFTYYYNIIIVFHSLII